MLSTTFRSSLLSLGVTALSRLGTLLPLRPTVSASSRAASLPKQSAPFTTCANDAGVEQARGGDYVGLFGRMKTSPRIAISQARQVNEE